MKIRLNKSKARRSNFEPISHVRVLDQDTPDNVTLISRKLTIPASEELHQADIINITERIGERAPAVNNTRITTVRQLAKKVIESFQPIDEGKPE